MAMNELNQKRGRADKGSSAAERIVVAVKAAKEIPRTAFAWALSHVAQPGDRVTLLVIVPSKRIGKRFWSFPRFSGDCANRSRGSVSGVPAETSTDIMDAFSKMVLQLNDVYDPETIDVNVKMLPGSPCGAVSAESKRIHTNWVIFDRQLRNEEKRCMAELQCNIVAMRHTQPKVLRLRLVGSHETEPQVASSLTHLTESSEKLTTKGNDASISNQGHTISSTNSPDAGASSFTATEAGVSSFISSSDPGTSPFSVSGMRVDAADEKINQYSKLRKENSESSGSDNEIVCPTDISELHPWAAEILRSIRHSKQIHGMAHNQPRREIILPGKSCKDVANVNITNLRTGSDLSIREAIPLPRNDFPGPPLCSICQHKTPVFGKPPRWFSYAELELATGGFSKANFLAEGGFGSVYRGVLPDGQVVAVKQHKLASSQGDLEFSSEVEVLSCAQHRNVVMLIGYCAEDRRRLLVYEYVCNGSLDSHLYGQNHKPLEWPARQKIARGAARGLRYLHEECRVGCIVHRDMRPNNILITHDYEPLVGDFGLARWQPDGDVAAETRVVGTFGYLAPEYAQSGAITEKADVYSFGVVLIELVTGRKAVDMNRPKGQQCLTEWVRPMLDEFATGNLVDSRLGCRYSEQEVSCMLYAASLCIRRDPNARPRMSQVIRILDGDVVMDPSFLSTTRYNVGNQSASVQQREQGNTGCMGSSSGRFHTGLSRTRLISYLDG